MANELKAISIKRLVADLEKQGARVRKTKKGWLIHFPNGESMIFHTTPSDSVRGIRNQRASVKRGGLLWPFDRKPRMAE